MYRKIKDYDDYLVTEKGEVFSFKRKKPRKMKPSKASNGYYQVGLWKDGKQKRLMVHRLVAQAYLEDYSEDLQVDHIDRNKTNNHISNLRMVTNQINRFNNDAAGCSYHKQSKKWHSQIMWNGKNITLGYFDSEEEAYLHYLDAKEEILKLI